MLIDKRKRVPSGTLFFDCRPTIRSEAFHTHSAKECSSSPLLGYVHSLMRFRKRTKVLNIPYILEGKEEKYVGKMHKKKDSATHTVFLLENVRRIHSNQKNSLCMRKLQTFYNIRKNF